MNGLMLTISHPDFVENDDEQRATFADDVARGWTKVQEAQELGVSHPVVREDADAGSVQVYFPYGPEGVDIRAAEVAAAALMMTVCYSVMHHNRGSSSEVLPAYGFSISRNVDVPEVTPPVVEA